VLTWLECLSAEWSQPSKLYHLIICSSVAAAVQGMDGQYSHDPSPHRQSERSFIGDLSRHRDRHQRRTALLPQAVWVGLEE
jgi:hypothetical protein